MSGPRVLILESEQLGGSTLRGRASITGWFVAAALVALLSSCAGTPEDNEALISAVAGQVSAYESVFGEIDGDCFARDVVPGLGGTMEIEEKYGLTVATSGEGWNLLDNTFPREDAAVVAGAMSRCGYLRTYLTEVAFQAGLAESDVDCLVEETGDAVLFIGEFETVFMEPDPDRFSLEDAFALKLYSTVNDCGADVDFLDWFTVEVRPRDS